MLVRNASAKKNYSFNATIAATIAKTVAAKTATACTYYTRTFIPRPREEIQRTPRSYGGVIVCFSPGALPDNAPKTLAAAKMPT